MPSVPSLLSIRLAEELEVASGHISSSCAKKNFLNASGLQMLFSQVEMMMLLHPRIMRELFKLLACDSWNRRCSCFFIRILSLDKLIKHADAILPFSNDALIDIVNTIEKARHKPGTGITEDPVLAMSDNEKKTKTWEATNSIIANLLMNLTAYVPIINVYQD